MDGWLNESFPNYLLHTASSGDKSGGSPLIVRVNVEQAVNAGGGEEAESQGTAGDYHASQVTLPFVFDFFL